MSTIAEKKILKSIHLKSGDSYTLKVKNKNQKTKQNKGHD